jgi:hypothetical protein
MSDPDDDILSELQVFFARVPAERIQLLDKCGDGEDDCLYEPVPQFEHSRNKAVIVLILNTHGEIRRIAVGRRGYSAGTGLSQIKLTHPRKTAPIQAINLPPQVEPRFQTFVDRAVRETGLVSPATSKALLGKLWFLMPEIREVIRLANSLNRNPIERFSKREQLRLQQESDASLIAMRIAGIDQEAHFRPDPTPDNNQWFLDMVAEPRLREDPMIIHDSAIFPGSQEIQRHMTGAVRFERDEVLLTVILINRQPLEELTGTDLIYYNENFRSFVMVQYKAMEPEGDDHVFRIPEPGLEKEIAQMKKFREAFKGDQEPQSAQGYRLNKGAFFLKFCPRRVPQLKAPELIPGMYFPLTHWNLLAESEMFTGPKGGKALRFFKKPPFSNAGRYLNNTEFVTLVGNAWIGTTVKQSNIVEQIIQKTLQTGRSVTLAIEDRDPEAND